MTNMPGDNSLAVFSLSVKERVRAMEQRDLDCAMPSFSVRTTKQSAIHKQPPATLGDDDTESVVSSVTSASVSSSTQYTSMTRKAGQLRKGRRSKNNKQAVAKKIDVANFAVVDEPSAEERDPQQEVPKGMAPSTGAEGKRHVDTGAQSSHFPDEAILDDAIDSLFEVEENAKDDEEKMDATDGIEGRDEDEAIEESRCSTPTVSQSVHVDSSAPPPTPAAQIGSLPHPPPLVRRANIPVERSKYEPITPDVDADNARTGLPLPSATRAFLSLPTLDESPSDEEPQDDTTPDKVKSSVEPLTENEKEIPQQLLLENDSGSVLSCVSDDTEGRDCIEVAIDSIFCRPSLDDDEDDDSECASRLFDWKERHTGVLRY